MTLTRRAMPRAVGLVARILLLPVVFGFALPGCTNNANRAVAGSVGIGTDVALSTPGSVTSLYVGGFLPIDASVTNDVNGAGVSWSCTDDTGQACSGPTGSGAFSNATPSTVDYASPTTTFQGAKAILITATSIANPSEYGQLTLLVLGTPVMNAESLYPGNINITYEADISATGGEQPLTWTLCTSTLTTNTACNAVASQPGYPGQVPPGLTLSGSTTGVSAISGTPTTTGTYTFWATVTDTASNVAPAQQYTITVGPQTACLLSGQYVFIVAGFRGGGPASHSGSINIDASTGVITGEQDYKDGNRVTPNEQLLPTSACENRSANSGLIILRAPSGALSYDFSVTPPDANGLIQSARLQLIGSGEDSASGQMALLDATAVTGAPPAGNFAFGMLGASNNVGNNAVRFGTIGAFVSTAGTISGEEDSNASTPVTAATLTGTVTAPDALGRGTATFTVGAQSEDLVYYIVNANKMYLMDVGTTLGSPRLTGFLTPQVGDASSTTFDNNALALQPSILSLWGAIGTKDPLVVDSLGRFSNGNAAAGTVDLVLDTAAQSVNYAAVPYSASYSIASNGRGTMTATTSVSGGPSAHDYVFYLDGVADGYILEPGSAAGSSGLLEAQYVPASGIYPQSLPNNFVSGTQYPQAPGPITLLALVSLNYGTLSSTYLNGSFAFDPTTGRGFGGITEVGLPPSDASYYLVSPTKIDLLRLDYGLRYIDGSLEWLIQN